MARAASTYLQDTVFAKLSAVETPFSDDAGRRLLASIGRDDQIAFDELAAEQEVHRRLDQISDEKPVAIASWEGFTQLGGCDRRMRVQRLKRLFPEGKILMILRRQDDLIRSYYAGAANLGLGHFGMRRFPDINTWLAVAPKYAPVRFLENCQPLVAVQHGETIREFLTVFGQDRVHLALFEQLKQDKLAFADSLSHALGLSPEILLEHLHDEPLRQAVVAGKVIHKVSFSSQQKLRTSPLNNRITRRLTKAIAPRLRPRLDTDINADWMERITEVCGASNRWIQAEWGLPLSAYQYPGCTDQ